MIAPLLLLAAASLAPLAGAAPSCSAPRRGPVLPLTGNGNDLPQPPSDVTLKRIALGFGIQNYTCAQAGTAAPTATGALAVLYDITGLYPGQGADSLSAQDFEALSSRALWSHDVPLSSGGDGGSDGPFSAVTDRPLELDGLPSALPFLGHHFFDARGVPTFVLDGGSVRVPTAKLNAVAPPAAADPGPEGTGAVGWLYLGAREGAVGAKFVYRVLTAGGQSHGCVNSAGDDSTSYTATYWFYG